MRGVIHLVFVMLVLLSAIVLFSCGTNDGFSNSIVREVSSSGMLDDDKNNNITYNDIMKVSEYGSLDGTVHGALLNHHSCTGGNAVYLFKGDNAVTEDINQLNADSVKSAPVKFDHSSKRYKYKFLSVKAGDYIIAFTCQAEADNHVTDDGIHFVGTSNVKVMAGKRVIKHLFPL